MGNSNKEGKSYSPEASIESPQQPKEVKKMEKQENLMFHDAVHLEWVKKKDNIYYPIEYTEIIKKIPSGYYNIRWDSNAGTFFVVKNDIKVDEIIMLPDSEHKDILKDIGDFFSSKEQYRLYDILYKRGILLYGKAGVGKSITIQLIVKEFLVRTDGLVFNIQDNSDLEAYSGFMKNNFRKAEPNRQIVVIMEDIESLLKRDSSYLLNILDGVEQFENVVYIATTNYPEQLQERILNRPSRFDRRYEVKLPNAKTRHCYLSSKLDRVDKVNIDIKKWVKDTEGLTISHLKELIIQVLVYENNYEDVIEVLQNMGKERIDSASFNKETTSLGFTNKKDSDSEGEYLEDEYMSKKTYHSSN